MELTDLINQLKNNLELMSETERISALSFLQKQQIIQARTDFYVFLRLMAPQIIPDQFQDGRHIKLFCNELERLEKSVNNRTKEKVQIFLPPGSMKTLTLCLFVAWIYGRHPEWYVLHIGHTTKFAEETFGQKIKDIINLPEYGIVFPDTKISKHTRSKGYWKTTSGGTYHATGVGNQIAGKRAHIAICDDVLSEQTALSKLERTKINHWYVPGLRSRLLPSGSEVIVNTRWHLDDLSGHIIRLDEQGEQKPWRVIKIPAILDEDGSKLLGLPVGTSFWPEFWKMSDLDEKRRTNTPAMWNALYMQNPVPDDGNIFKKNHFLLYDTLSKGWPECDYFIIALDTAFSTKNNADFSAWQVWGVFTRKVVDLKGAENQISGMLLFEAGKDRLDYPSLALKIKELDYEFKPKYIIIEDKASGQSLLQDLVLQGLPVVPFKPDVDKERRAHSCVPFLEAGLIFIPEHEMWAKEFLDELLQFPAGAYDDQVDCCTQAILWMRDNMMLSRPEYGRMQDDDDDEPTDRRKPKTTYWRATLKR